MVAVQTKRHFFGEFKPNELVHDSFTGNLRISQLKPQLSYKGR